jgi:hypothetical protein
MDGLLVGALDNINAQLYVDSGCVLVLCVMMASGVAPVAIGSL